MKKRISDLLFDLRHPWWTFTREIALLHCQRTGQRLTPASPTGVTGAVFNVGQHTPAALIAAQERDNRARRDLIWRDR